MITAEKARKNVKLYKRSTECVNNIMDSLEKDIVHTSTHGLSSCFRTIQYDDPEILEYISIFLKNSLNKLGFDVRIDSFVECSFRVNISW